MSKISCCIKLGEVPLHLYQVTAGFLLLKQQGIIDLKIEKLPKGQKIQLPYNMIEVIIDGDIRILYDLNDGYDNLLNENQSYVKFMNELLADFDFCFKRSFSRMYNAKLQDESKIYPLGLNYMVTVPGNISHFPTHFDPWKEQMKKVIRMLPFSEYYNGLYGINTFEDIPKKIPNPKILFMARLWDIDGGNGEWIASPIKKEERRYINDMRAKCIRLCRKEFGNQFFGGVSPSNYSLEHYPDIVIKDRTITKRNRYLEKVKEASICIATTGLHESIGWKFGEYVAASKAIVTEELQYELPGEFRNESNYLVFKSPEKCVEHIFTLINNEDFRYQMMVNNYQYYHWYGRPDRLVLNSLLTVLNKGGTRVEANADRVYAYI